MTQINFDNSYARLPERFFSQLAPEPVSQPAPIRVNRELALSLGLDPDWLESPAGTEVLAGNALPEGAAAIATVYAGHQFGSWNPQLGDGRALLLGEVLNPAGERFDLQLKGSGRTPYSRGGDGRSPLGPVLREYVVSEAMAALGIPTTRALAAVSTGDAVYRETALPGAVLARVASSHIRIGTFQFFASRNDTEGLQLLADHVIERHYPAAAGAERPVLALLEGVIAAQASLVARWQGLGFIHGVMNTDNMLLSGETIDYGPCAFMEAYDPETVFSSIDHGGRYAYRNQPGIAHWNLANLAQALLSLIDENQDRAVELAQDAINTFPETFLANHQRVMNDKLGLAEVREGDEELVHDLLQLLATHKLDFTLAFRHLADLAAETEGRETIADLFQFPWELAPWLQRWEARQAAEGDDAAARQARMDRANPAFIPRNHQLEAAIRAAEDDDNLQPFHDLVEVLAKPFDYRPARRDYALPAQAGQEVRQTFCGT